MRWEENVPVPSTLRQKVSVSVLLVAVLLAPLAYFALPAEAQSERYEQASRGGLRPYQVDLIVAYFPPEQIDTAIAVVACESRGETGAVGLVGERGMFQIRPEFHQWRADRLFWPGASLFHPEVNVAVAADLWADAGWWPWSCAR